MTAPIEKKFAPPKGSAAFACGLVRIAVDFDAMRYEVEIDTGGPRVEREMRGCLCFELE